MEKYTKCSTTFAVLLLTSSPWAHGASLIWSDGNWGESEWNSGLMPPSADEIDDIIDDIIIPIGEGESISDEAIEQIGKAVEATSGLTQNLVENIDETNEDDVINALSSIGNVVGVSGGASGNITGSGNAAEAAATGTGGSTAIDNFAKLLSALDNKTNASEIPVELSVEQKQAVQEAAIQAVASAVNILVALPEEGVARKAVLEDLGRIISSSVNLGLALTGEQADSLFEATDQTTDENADLDDQLETSVPIAPRNKALVSKQVLNEALGGAIAGEELDTFLQELATAINPADVNIGGVSGEESLSEGFSEAVGDGSGAVNFDPGTGIITFSFGGADGQPSSGAVQFLALGSPVTNIPARVVSANVVASGFPDGVRVLADGAVVVT
ncbi:MAG: hypothetical protein RQ899_14905, partial [Pseudomonadales bacterium]|nr:hypothetical protein [Pseudomonadales bacterium]